MNTLRMRKYLGALGLTIVFGVATAFGCSCVNEGNLCPTI